MRLAVAPAVVLLLGACAGSMPAAMPGPAPTQPLPAGARSIDDDLAFLQSHAPVEVLEAPGGGRVVVSARWQARVMTSAVEPHGASLGFVHRTFIEAGKTGTAFDNYGGEDRFWLGPEGGQFGLYFPPGAPFAIGSWQVPHEMQEGEWAVTARDAAHVTFTRRMHVVSWSGSALDVAVERTVRVLGAEDVRARFGVAPPDGSRWVAFESDNRITNAGATAWTRDKGLPSIWILGMYSPAPDAQVLVPFDPGGTGPVVNDAYFGKVPADRLVVHDEGWLSLRADGQYRSKIGLSPARARDVAGSYSASARLLTLVHYAKPASAPDGYVNSLWAKQPDPYGGDVVNAYNDGPTEPGKPSLGGFYELETSSPAAALAPRQSMEHVHTTLHVTGDEAALDGLARRVLGVSIAQGAARPAR
ncbi:MAG TPA: DUF6786 family protein [Polyangiaceae bacterium]